MGGREHIATTHTSTSSQIGYNMSIVFAICMADSSKVCVHLCWLKPQKSWLRTLGGNITFVIHRKVSSPHPVPHTRGCNSTRLTEKSRPCLRKYHCWPPPTRLWPSSRDSACSAPLLSAVGPLHAKMTAVLSSAHSAHSDDGRVQSG